MPALGFGSTVGHRAPDLANFPSDGLVALYKCDETDGAYLNDATGNLDPLVPVSGIALDCATQTQYIVDGTGLRALLNGLDPLVVFGFEIVTPALASGTPQYIIGGTATSAANAPGVQVYISQAANLGDTVDRWSMTVNCRMSVDGAAVTNNAIGAITKMGLKAGTAYQIIGKYTATVGAVNNLTIYYRETTSGEWLVSTTDGSVTPATSVTIVEGATSIYRLGCYGAGTSPFKGALAKAFLAVGSVSVANLKAALASESASAIQGILGTNARYWHFKAGSGTAAYEYITEASTSTTGTEAWGLYSGITQYGLRQGHGSTGPVGFALGGETSAVGVGKYAVTSRQTTPLIGSADGWTLVAIMRVGDTLPAAERELVSVYGPLTTGADESDITKTPGIHLTYTAAGLITARRKNSYVADATAGSSSNLGAGARYSTNGQFTIYAFSSDSTGALKARRVGLDDTSVTTEATVAASYTNLNIRATNIRIGSTALDCDVVVGYVALYNRELTDAEIYRLRSAQSKMTGASVWVDADTAAPGNGTERFPYADLQSALRVNQVSGTIYLNGGAANQRIASDYATSSPLRPATLAGMTLVGTNDPVIVSDLGDATKYPLYLEEGATGTWSFTGITFDATDAGVADPDDAGPYVGGGTAGAVVVLDGIDHLVMTGCTTKNAARWSASSGTGLTSRAPNNTITNHTSTANGEHGYYFRIAGSTTAVYHTATLVNCVADSNSDDGIKFSNEDSSNSGARDPIWWENLILDSIYVNGGANQISLIGVKGGALTNFLCEGEDNGLATTAGLTFGGTGDNEETTNVAVFNGTIRDYGTTQGYAVKNANSTGCSIINVVTGNCFADLIDTEGTLTSSYCSGDSGHATLLWPTGNENEPDATITFVGAGPGYSDAHLDTGSDGLGTGANLWTVSDYLQSNLNGDLRDDTDPWDRGAF